MTDRRFDLDDTRPLEPADPVIGELERYAQDTASEPPPTLREQVLTAIAREPAPRPGWLAALGAPFASPFVLRPAQAAALLFVVTLGVAGALAFSGLLDVLRESRVGDSPAPAPSVAPTDSASPSPTPTLTPTPTPSPSTTPTPTPLPPPPLPTATDDDNDEFETPEPTDDNSGPGSGDAGDDDSSGPGSGG